MSLLIKNHSNIHMCVGVSGCGRVCVVTVGARFGQRLLIATSLVQEICYKIYSKHETHEKVYKNCERAINVLGMQLKGYRVRKYIIKKLKCLLISSIIQLKFKNIIYYFKLFTIC